MTTHSDALATFDQLCDLVAETAPTGPPVVLGIELTHDGVAIHSKRVGDLDELVGFVAPDGWSGIGIAAGGRRVGAERGAPFDLSVVHLVHRSGASFARVVDGGHPIVASGAGEVEGRVSDLCRRALRIATRPPTEPVERLWSTVWLDRILGERLATELGAAPPTWAHVCALHPRGPRPERAVGLRRPARSLVAHDWDELRLAVAAGREHDSGVPASDAAWFDAGSFARHAIGRLPPLEDLVSDLSYLLPGAVAQRIRRTVFTEVAA